MEAIQPVPLSWSCSLRPPAHAARPFPQAPQPVSQAELRSSGWALIPQPWCPYKKRGLRTRREGRRQAEMCVLWPRAKEPRGQQVLPELAEAGRTLP